MKGSSREVRHPELSRHLPESLQVLEQQAEWVRATVSTPGWEVLLGLVEREIALIDHEIESRNGRPLESRADYAGRLGRRGGLRAFGEFAEALLDRAESRLEEQRRKHERPVGAGVEA